MIADVAEAPAQKGDSNRKDNQITSMTGPVFMAPQSIFPSQCCPVNLKFS
jgi:hypothetical protein